jgi:hypothetical protein
MNYIDVRRFGFAVGATGGILYLGCALILFLAGRDMAVWFTNSLLHGLDVSGIIRMNIPLSDIFIGLINTFIISWLSGACIAAIYNVSGELRV